MKNERSGWYVVRHVNKLRNVHFMIGHPSSTVLRTCITYRATPKFLHNPKLYPFINSISIHFIFGTFGVNAVADELLFAQSKNLLLSACRAIVQFQHSDLKYLYPNNKVDPKLVSNNPFRRHRLNWRVHAHAYLKCKNIFIKLFRSI